MIEATSYSEQVLGAYSLTLTHDLPVVCTPISYGQTVEGSLESTDGFSANRTTSYADCYTFTAGSGDPVVISMTSSEVDTYLYLTDASGELIESNDDGGEGSDSRIPSEGTVTIPSAGTYTIEATSFSSAETGTYSLTRMRVDAISSAIASPSGNGNAKPDRRKKTSGPSHERHRKRSVRTGQPCPVAATEA